MVLTAWVVVQYSNRSVSCRRRRLVSLTKACEQRTYGGDNRDVRSKTPRNRTCAGRCVEWHICWRDKARAAHAKRYQARSANCGQARPTISERRRIYCARNCRYGVKLMILPCLCRRGSLCPLKPGPPAPFLPTLHFGRLPQLRRYYSFGAILPGAPAPTATVRGTGKVVFSRSVFILNIKGRANCARSGDIPPKLYEVGMRDDPVGDIDGEIAGSIACAGSRDEHESSRAVV